MTPILQLLDEEKCESSRPRYPLRTQCICLALAMVLNCSFTSGQWLTQNSGTTQRLFAVSFIDANTGTVVGDSGTILRTTNAGAKWTSQTSGTTRILFGVTFSDANYGTVVGDSGTILRTTNGGATWTNQSAGTTLRLRGVCFTDTNNGTVLGGGEKSGTAIGWSNMVGSPPGIILHTTNGGATWMKQLQTDSASLNAVSFSDGNSGTAVGGGLGNNDSCHIAILHTTDGGATWTSQSGLSRYYPYALLSVSFTDAMTGTAVGGSNNVGGPGLILQTTNGGVNWMIKWEELSPLGGTYLTGVCFTGTNTGTAVGLNQARSIGSQVIIRTTDGGASWTEYFGGSGALYAVCFTDADHGTVVGDAGTILHTTNGGVAWVERQQNGVPQQYLLHQNYPNPFNPVTTIGYTVGGTRNQESGFRDVRLSVYDILGREVAMLVNEKKAPGTYEVTFDGSNLASGVYLYRLQAGDFTQTKRLLLLK